MDLNTRFTILPFPQYFDGSVLNLNIVFLPRNQNPTAAAISGSPTIPDALPFATANPKFVARIIPGLDNFPTTALPFTPVTLTTIPAGDRTILFQTLAAQFNITSIDNSNIPFIAPPAQSVEKTVNKYLPFTYRKSFNFTNPVPNAKIDDSYHCAMRNETKGPFPAPSEWVNWGQVFAYVMRQPLLAQKLGMIYQTSFPVDASYFKDGGWLYIDLADGSDYETQQTADNTFINLYSARIPALIPGKSRMVFAPVLFPVLALAPTDAYDAIFSEASNYDDGFAKIVHSFQQVSQNMLQEEGDGFHPVKESGIRLGWDDEQILTWYVRALAVNPGGIKRIDAPMGVAGYRIDTRLDGAADWETLNFVTGRAPLAIGAQTIGTFSGELNYSVYPSKINSDPSGNYWLPMYFANWSGKSIVLPDDDAADIYQNNADVKANTNTGITGGVNNNLNKIYLSGPINTVLKYGNIYDFRVRLADLSGGGPAVIRHPEYDALSPIAKTHFKRYVAPAAVNIAGLVANNDTALFTDAALTMQRPLLGYPAVVFTGKYADPIGLLKTASLNMAGKQAFGIADPDVESVEITVEIKALQMDNLLSVTGKESYIKYFTTIRKFPVASSVFDDTLSVPLQYVDAHVLNFGDDADLGADFGFTQMQIDSMQALPLPKARTIRLSIRAVCKEIDGYYGLENADPVMNTRYGRSIQFQCYQPSQNETKLLLNTSPASRIQGIFLQPDLPVIFNGDQKSVLFGKTNQIMPDIMQRFSQQLQLQNNGLTLVANKGQRIQFGCSNRLRHTLSPDNASLSFASKADLINHWLVCLTLELNRDWTWDALQNISFVIVRKKRFMQDDVSETETMEVGSINLSKAISINALQNPDRDTTTLLFIDAVEPKNALMQPAPNQNELRFPDLIELEYTITASFKTGHGAQQDPSLVLDLQLPIINIPAQIPKIVSAGIALSPYTRNEKYSSTGPRQRYLWIEFDEPVNDPKDIYFARTLAYAPDQLISNNNPEMFSAPDEPALPIDPEYIRVVTPGQSIDRAGADAMQPMQKAEDSDKHYILPLPPGLHPESAEMFGFFTYEIRLGHYVYAGTTQNVWTTAQGRFGRALRVTGVQHPAPVLVCNVNRDEDKVYLSAPYATAVYKGKNVSSVPPRTEIWALLYAQVKQADNLDWRNILLSDKKLDWRVQIDFQGETPVYQNLNRDQVFDLKLSALQNWNPKISGVGSAPAYKLKIPGQTNQDATKYGLAVWTNEEIQVMLDLYGLPDDSPLSVLCVEMLPTITNIYDHINQFAEPAASQHIKTNFTSFHPGTESDLKQASERFSDGIAQEAMAYIRQNRPLSDQLGEYRILRTSPLTEVPFVCCPTC